MGNPSTIRSLARDLGLSRTTVSSALRNDPRVSPQTVELVRKAAQEAGYQQNPLASSLMSELRLSRGGLFRGVVAAIEIDEPDRLPHGNFHRDLVNGAAKRAHELGFGLDEFVVGRDGMTMKRLDGILKSRSISGLLLLPSWVAPDFSAFDWGRYSAVYTDYNQVRPDLHSVCCDLYRSMMLTLEKLRGRGYRQPGLVIDRARDERLHLRYTASFHAFSAEPATRATAVPPLVVDNVTRATFEEWFKRFRPDAVLCHSIEVMDWMEACGAHVPATHAFVCLNTAQIAQPCAGIDLAPREIGARGIELVIAQIFRNERGIPLSPTRTTVRARWVEGPTVLPESNAPIALPMLSAVK